MVRYTNALKLSDSATQKGAPTQGFAQPDFVGLAVENQQIEQQQANTPGP